MNRRGFLRSLASAAVAVVAAPAVGEASTFTPTWTGSCSGRWSSGLRRGDQFMIYGGARGGGKTMFWVEMARNEKLRVAVEQALRPTPTQLEFLRS